MKFETLLEITNAHYPDDQIIDHWDRDRQQPVSHDEEGDTLALFIVRELRATFDPDAPDVDQLESAVGVLEKAFVELGKVRVGLMAEFLKRRRGGV